MRLDMREKEYEQAYAQWEEESKKQTNGKQKRGAKKPQAIPPPVRRELSPSPEPMDEPILTEQEEITRREEEYAAVLQGFKDREQYYAVRPMTDAVKYVTNGVRSTSPFT